MRVESVDEVEVYRRIEKGIYDKAEFTKAKAWVKRYCPTGFDKNPDGAKKSEAELEKDWDFTIKCALIIKDLMNGNTVLKDMFTGLYPHSNGGITNTVPLLQGVKTIGEYLTPMGIHSAYVGKWHLDGGDYFGNGVCPAGYDPDYWFDMRRYLDGMTSEERLRSRKEATSLSGVKAESTYAHQVSDRALSFLEKAADEDFFLAVSYDEPHQPFICPEPFASLYKDYEVPLTPDYDDTLEGKPLLERLWAGANRKADRKNLHIRPQLFLGCNSFVDWEIGRVLEAVKKHGSVPVSADLHPQYVGGHGVCFPVQTE